MNPPADSGPESFVFRPLKDPDLPTSDDDTVTSGTGLSAAPMPSGAGLPAMGVPHGWSERARQVQPDPPPIIPQLPRVVPQWEQERANARSLRSYLRYRIFATLVVAAVVGVVFIARADTSWLPWGSHSVVQPAGFAGRPLVHTAESDSALADLSSALEAAGANRVVTGAYRSDNSSPPMYFVAAQGTTGALHTSSDFMRGIVQGGSRVAKRSDATLSESPAVQELVDNMSFTCESFTLRNAARSVIQNACAWADHDILGAVLISDGSDLASAAAIAADAKAASEGHG